MRILLALLSSLLLLPAAAVADPPAPDSSATRPLIEQVVQAYGGRKALERVKAFREEGRVVALARKREGPTTRLFQRPNRLRLEVRYPDAPETRIVDGHKGWRGMGGKVEEASGPMLDAMALQAARSNVPWLLMEHADDVHAIAPRDQDGRQLPGLEIAMGEGLTLRLYLDPETHRMARSQSLIGTGADQTTFETVYGDYRKVNGILFPFHEENWAGDTHTADTTFERVTLNPKVAPGDFGAPAARSSGT